MPEPAGRRVLWRAYVPQWAFDPLSGAGAARFGGRWNETEGQALVVVDPEHRLPKTPASWL